MPCAPNGSKQQGLAAPRSPAAELAAIERACEELAHCDCLPTVKNVRDQAEVFRHYARSAKKGLALINKAAETKIRAERRMGQLLAEMGFHGGDRVGDSHHLRATLKKLNISHTQSSRWQKAAEVPEEEFRKLVEAAREHQFELTAAALLRLATTLRKKRDVNAAGQHPSPRRRSAASSPQKIINELENHCTVFDGILSSVYDAPGPVDLHSAEKRHLRRLVREFRSLLDDLKQQSTSKQSSEDKHQTDRQI